MINPAPDREEQEQEREREREQEEHTRVHLCRALRIAERCVGATSYLFSQHALQKKEKGKGHHHAFEDSNETLSIISESSNTSLSLLGPLLSLCEAVNKRDININNNNINKNNNNKPAPELITELVRVLSSMLTLPWWSPPSTVDESASSISISPSNSTSTYSVSHNQTPTVGMSEKWKVVAILTALLQYDKDPHLVVQRQTLKCCGVLVTKASPR